MTNDLSSLQKAILKETPHNQLFAVVSWGCAATQWLAKVLNSHPQILCLHHGLNALSKFNLAFRTDPIPYFHALTILGSGYSAVGDVHGIPRHQIPILKDSFGSRFNAAIVIREPLARIRSQLALFHKYRGLNAWDLSSISSLDFPTRSDDDKMFLLAASMLNAITEEISLATIYKAEDLTSDPNTLGSLIFELTNLTINPGWLQDSISLSKVNAHQLHDSQFTDWQLNALRSVVLPEAWSLYQQFGYHSTLA